MVDVSGHCTDDLSDFGHIYGSRYLFLKVSYLGFLWERVWFSIV